MKLFKKICAVALALIIALACFVSLASAKYYEPSSEIEGRKNLLVLGDSIAQGFGVANPSEAAYARIVADTNGYNYRNFAMSAHDTADFIDEITNYLDIVESVKWADIINISTGSNNYLANPDVVGIAIGALLGVNSKQLDEIADGVYEDLLRIYDIIRELNPDAKIIFNNVYCAWSGLGHIPFIKASSRVNEKIYKLQEVHDDIIIFDVDSIITHKNELIAQDCVHPNSKGNIEIAKAMLALLKEEGLGENTEPVILQSGVDYNFYVKSFGKFGGAIIDFIVKVLTLNF